MPIFATDYFNGFILPGVGAHREAREMGGPGLGHAGKHVNITYLQGNGRCVCSACFGLLGWTGKRNSHEVTFKLSPRAMQHLLDILRVRVWLYSQCGILIFVAADEHPSFRVPLQ